MWPKIDANTDPKEIQRIHEDIWNYVIENGHKPQTQYIFDCVLCEYAAARYHEFTSKYSGLTTVSHCDFCPAIWDPEDIDLSYCWESWSPYSKWLPNDNPLYDEEQSRKAAEQIRDIPFDFNKVKEKITWPK